MKRVLSVFLVVVLLLPMFGQYVTASTMQADIEATDQTFTIGSPQSVNIIQNTTAMSANEYVTALGVADNNIDTGSSIQTVCELFISAIYANRRNERYDISCFAVDNSLKSNTLAYLSSMNQYQREINALCNYNIVSDRLIMKDFSAVVNGDNCAAQITIQYYYDITGSFEKTCNVNCVYYLSLEKDNNSWRISEVRTSMPNENGEGFIYQGFDAHAMALAVVQTPVVAEEVMSVADDNVSVNAIYPLGSVTYDEYAAIEYAEQYYNRRNSLFLSLDSNCQNFASQCVWAGFLDACGATGSSRYARPALSTSIVGSSATNLWCNGQATTYYDNYHHNWIWDNVNGFLMMISSNDYTQEGPQGIVCNGVAYASMGDIIYYDRTRQCSVSEATFEHAMFVTDVTGTQGSRNTSNIFIAANSSSTTSAYMPLSQYVPYSSDYFVTACIYSGMYCVQGANVPTVPFD